MRNPFFCCAEAKKKIMAACGIHVVDSPADIGKKMAEVLN